MTKFLLIRHGNSEAVEFAPGRMPEVHLSQEGKKQVHKLAERISSYHIDMIFSSPIERTRETAEAIAGKFNKKVELLEGLTELELGEFTGKSFSELENFEKWHQYHSLRSITRIPSGELFIEVQARMLIQIDKLQQTYPGKNIILVSHGEPIKSAIAYYAGIPVDLAGRINIDTASVSMLSLSSRTVKINFINKWGFHLND